MGCVCVKDSKGLISVGGCAQMAVKNAKGINAESRVRPSVLALSRQAMPNLPGTSREGAAKGGYIVHGGDAKPDVIIMSTGAPPARHLGGACRPW